MFSYNSLSLKVKSIIQVGIIVTLVQLISTGLSVSDNYNQLKVSLYNRINLITEMQSDSLSIALWDYNLDLTKLTLDKIANDKAFVYGEIHDPYGEKLAKNGKLRDQNNNIEITKKIFYQTKDNYVGHIKLYFSKAELNEGFRKNIIHGIFSFLVMQVAVLGIIFLSLIQITYPIERITKLVEKIKDGDLSNKIPYLNRKDEIGNIALAVHALQKTSFEIKQNNIIKLAEKEERQKLIASIISEFNGAIIDAISSLNNSSQIMVNNSKDMINITNEFESDVNNVSDSSTEISKKITNIVTSADGVSDLINEISIQIDNSSKLVTKTFEKTSSAIETTVSLKEAMDQISEVINFIGTIAHQINMLSLNATIESSRAGEAGKGFAVVASEVKNLAMQTSKATNQINEKIQKLFSASSSVTDSIHDIKSSIDKIKQNTSYITAAIEKQNSMADNIFNNMRDAADNTEGVSGKIQNISLLSSNAHKTGATVMQASEIMQDKSKKISALIDEFLQKVQKNI